MSKLSEFGHQSVFELAAEVLAPCENGHLPDEACELLSMLCLQTQVFQCLLLNRVKVVFDYQHSLFSRQAKAVFTNQNNRILLYKH